MQYYADIEFGGDELSCLTTADIKKKLDLLNEGNKDLFFIHGFIFLVILMVGIPFLIYSIGQTFMFSVITILTLSLYLCVSLFFETKGRKKYKNSLLKRYKERLENNV